MKAEERKELQQNDLAKGASSILGTLRTGNLAAPWAYRAVGLTFAVIAIIGLVWYLRSESRKEASHEWTQFATSSGPELETVAADYAAKLPGKAARLQMARNLLGEQGIGKLTAQDRESQNKAIANIEKARDDLKTIAADLTTHKVLRAAALAEAAVAEMALVGVPKSGDSPETRGTVKMAADYYTQAAAVIGTDTPAGVELTKKATEMTANHAMLTKAALEIYSRTMPLPSFDATRPGGIKTPDSLTPRTGVLPTGDPIKAPEAPVTTPNTKK